MAPVLLATLRAVRGGGGGGVRATLTEAENVSGHVVMRGSGGGR